MIFKLITIYQRQKKSIMNLCLCADLCNGLINVLEMLSHYLALSCRSKGLQRH